MKKKNNMKRSCIKPTANNFALCTNTLKDNCNDPNFPKGIN